MTKSIQVKQPELETKRIQLLEGESKLWKERRELQDKLLFELSSAQGDVLKNEVSLPRRLRASYFDVKKIYDFQKLLQTLNEVKASSSSIDWSLQESKEIKEKLMREYDQYKDICFKAAHLFTGINQIYSMPVTVFTSLFIKSIQSSDEFDQRKIYEQLVKLTYNQLSRSISKNDHIALGLHTFRKAYPEQVSDREWESFITNFNTSEDPQDHTLPTWLSKSIASKVLCLKINHPEFYSHLKLDNEQLWSNFVGSGADVPVAMTEFQRILVTQILRADLLTAAMKRSMSKVLHTSIPAETKPTIQQLFDESQEDEPIVLISSGEMDPSQEVQAYARSKLNAGSYVEMAIGKGEEQAVMQQIRRAAENGHWACVKNVQLVPQWLNKLNDEMQMMKITRGFRIWLVCDSIRQFPPSLLAKSTKVLYEAPHSVKSKVQRLVQQWTSLLVQKRDGKQLKLFIALFILNSVLQERRSFIPHGWTTAYEFSDSDLKAAIDIIGWLEKSLTFKMNWTILKELLRLIAYGGRMINGQDQQILKTNLDEFLNSKTLGDQWQPLQMKLNLHSTSNNIQDYVAAVSQLPDADPPQAFGLSAVTSLLRDNILCRNILKQLRSKIFLVNNVSGVIDFIEFISESDFSSEGQINFEKRLKPILSLWKKLNEVSSCGCIFSNASQRPLFLNREPI